MRSMSSICIVEECMVKVKGAGYCDRHYQQFRRTGSPYRRNDPRFGGVPLDREPFPTKEERFEASIEKEDGHWWWTGPMESNGYAILRWRTEQILAHRYSWVRENGPIPDGHVIVPACERRCVAPDHLELISRSEHQKRAAQTRAERRASRYY